MSNLQEQIENILEGFVSIKLDNKGNHYVTIEGIVNLNFSELEQIKELFKCDDLYIDVKNEKDYYELYTSTREIVMSIYPRYSQNDEED